jgi:hypothetical protein
LVCFFFNENVFKPVHYIQRVYDSRVPRVKRKHFFTNVRQLGLFLAQKRQSFVFFFLKLDKGQMAKNL